MNNSLTNKIPENFLHVIHLIVTTAEDLQIPILVVGATVRDILFADIPNVEIKRATKDIDFGVAVEDWNQFEELKRTLAENQGFRIDNKAKQRLWHGKGQDEVKIDFIPYGGVEAPSGEVAFPPDKSFVMNTQGFAEAYNNSLNYALNEKTVVKMASLPCLTILKFIAYRDRPQERKKDIQDIWFIMKNYLDYLEKVEDGNRLYEDFDLMDEEGFDMKTIGARLLGRDIRKILTEQTAQIILEYLSPENDESLINLAEMIAYQEGVFAFDNEVKEIFENLRLLRKGFLERFDD